MSKAIKKPKFRRFQRFSAVIQVDKWRLFWHKTTQTLRHLFLGLDVFRDANGKTISLSMKLEATQSCAPLRQF